MVFSDRNKKSNKRPLYYEPESETRVSTGENGQCGRSSGDSAKSAHVRKVWLLKEPPGTPLLAPPCISHVEKSSRRSFSFSETRARNRRPPPPSKSAQQSAKLTGCSGCPPPVLPRFSLLCYFCGGPRSSPPPRIGTGSAGLLLRQRRRRRLLPLLLPAESLQCLLVGRQARLRPALIRGPGPFGHEGAAKVVEKPLPILGFPTLRAQTF